MSFLNRDYSNLCATRNLKNSMSHSGRQERRKKRMMTRSYIAICLRIQLVLENGNPRLDLSGGGKASFEWIGSASNYAS